MAVSVSNIISTLGQDTRQAARRLVRSPSFTIASVLTLALALGANGAIYAVVKHVVIDPLPYAESDWLIDLDHGAQRLKVANGLGTDARASSFFITLIAPNRFNRQRSTNRPTAR